MASEAKGSSRRQLLKGIVLGGVAVATTSAIGYTGIKPIDDDAQKSKGSDPTFDGNGIQLPPLTSDPPHREGSVYFRSDLLQMRLDDGTSYYTLQKQQVFSKGGVILAPIPQTIVVWRAQFDCTVTAIKAYQDTGSGSVVTGYNGSTNLLNGNTTISKSATWQDGGSIAEAVVSAGDSIAIAVVSVSGSPNYLVIQIEMTQP